MGRAGGGVPAGSGWPWASHGKPTSHHWEVSAIVVRRCELCAYRLSMGGYSFAAVLVGPVVTHLHAAKANTEEVMEMSSPALVNMAEVKGLMEEGLAEEGCRVRPCLHQSGWLACDM
jgi:hypothetical protein